MGDVDTNKFGGGCTYEQINTTVIKECDTVTWHGPFLLLAQVYTLNCIKYGIFHVILLRMINQIWLKKRYYIISDLKENLT